MHYDNQFCDVESEMGVLARVLDLTTHPRMEKHRLVFSRNCLTKIVNAYTDRPGIIAG